MGSTPAPAELLAPGTSIGRYYLLQRLAIGGMAELYLACAKGLAGFQRIVVLKHVLPHLASDPDFVALFLREARLAAALAHPNIVQVTDIGETAGDYFFVMEYVHGRNARELLGEAARRGGLPLEVALSIVIAAAEGLGHAHAATDPSGARMGLIHRDVSPANLLVSYEGSVKLTDFGIAKASEKTQDTIGGLKGKVGYMSPEQCRGEIIDQRSDIFSLGVVLFELTTCQRLFFGHNDFSVLNQVLTGKIDRPSERVPGYPAALEEIVMKALAFERDDRYASVSEMRDALETFVHEERMRTSPATVAAWMVEVFGRPEPPIVEPGHHPSFDEPVPTLVVTARVEPRDDEAARQRRMGWLPWAAAVVGALSLGAGAYALQQRGAPDGPQPAAVRTPQPAVEPTVVPAKASTEGDEEPVVEVAPAPDVGAVPPAPRNTRRSSKKRKKRRKDKDKPKRDINALFPVEAG